MTMTGTVTALDAALGYAARGWRVIPIKPGQKHPAMPAWQEAATTDTTLIRDWWARWPDHGVGIATGEASDLFVLDVDISDGKAGDETLADLEHTYSPLPATVEVVTGTGGRHIYFRMPLAELVRNDAGKRLGPGLDIRGEGGQVLAPPTIHPNGTPYQWELSSSPDLIDVANPPAWLLELLTATPAQPDPRPPARVNGHRPPGVRWADDTTWTELLTKDGATYLGTRTEHHSGQPYEMWARPGVDHASGTVGYRGSDVLKVFSSEWRVNGVLLEQEATYSKFAYYTHTRHGGDYHTAAQALRDAGYDDRAEVAAWLTEIQTATVNPLEQLEQETAAEIEGHGWLAHDLTVVLADGYQPPQPTICPRSDGICLFYPGRINALIGESGCGKSWVAQLAAVTVLQAGRHVIYIDLEDHASSLTRRLLDLGADPATIAERFAYVQPELGYNPDARLYIEDYVTGHDVGLVCVDSVGEAMALQGAKQNDDDDVARWYRLLPRRLAALGPAVTLIDHIPKAKDAPTGYAIGSQRKRAAIDGAGYRVEQVTPFGRGRNGIATLVTTKDRNGVHPTGRQAAKFHLNAVTALTATLAAPEGISGPFRPTVLMQRVSEYLEHGPARTQRNIEQYVTGKGEALRKALEVLVAEGFVGRKEDGDGHHHWSIRPFREVTEIVETGEEGVENDPF